jgi:exodeoxyribonuclease VII small subunit
MPRKPAPGQPPPDFWSYEDTIAALEAMVVNLEAGNLPLTEVLEQFEQAVQALQRCETYLQEKRQQVDLLIETLADP